ncbi:hypothetical protein H7K20_27995 [Priestia aryabhattai]|uniref:hypothetical protein n=1 Tax=Priestia aryabhattai TaxID=412384 RepID=UPI001C8E49EC|nr:hypothetical protein [Priestia aryabhattai]MBY0030897.1 hypothetical protein [Priestia aryabhattai]
MKIKMSKTILDKGLDYVLENGNELERWNAKRLSNVNEELPLNWTAKQNQDGGWNSKEFKSTVSNMGTTSVTLMRLIFFKLQQLYEIKKTVDFLWSSQQEDGRWGENPDQYKDDPPEWNKPGDLKVEIWETANNLASLSNLGYTNDSRVLRGIQWVESHKTASGQFPGYIHTTHAMAAVKFLQKDYEASEKYMEQSYQFLNQNKHKDWFDVMDLIWPLILWSNAQISPKHSVVNAYFSELISKRSEDGIWTSIYPNCDAQYTIEAISLLENYRI